jgi:DNA-directed RNA polymerase specialized sigma subunit
MKEYAPGQPWLNSIRDLKLSYRKTHRKLQAARDKTEDPSLKIMLTDMISDVNYSIEWMHTGRRPGNKRGIERLAAYQRETPVPPERLIHRFNQPPPRRMEINDYNRLIQVLNILSFRERACFEMYHVGLWSEYDIADHLDISRDSVHEYLNRAKLKINNFISKPMQMELFPLE